MHALPREHVLGPALHGIVVEAVGRVYYLIVGDDEARDRWMLTVRDEVAQASRDKQDRQLGAAGSARASLYVYNTPEEIDAFADAMRATLDMFGELEL